MLYRAVIEDAIEVDGERPVEAAWQMWTAMCSPGGPIMTVVDENGQEMDIDLSHVQHKHSGARLDEIIDWFNEKGRLPYVEPALGDQV